MRDRYYNLVWELLSEHDPRPHWGKDLQQIDGLVGCYPRGADFRQLARRHDPDGRFRSGVMGRLLGL